MDINNVICTDDNCYNCNPENDMYCERCLNIYLKQAPSDIVTEIYSNLMSILDNSEVLPQVLESLNIDGEITPARVAVYKEKLFNYINNNLLEKISPAKKQEQLSKAFKFCLKSIDYAVENMTVEELYDVYNEASRKLDEVVRTSPGDKALAEASKERLFNIINIIMLKKEQTQ
jgi:hypothetical protein